MLRVDCSVCLCYSLASQTVNNRSWSLFKQCVCFSCTSSTQAHPAKIGHVFGYSPCLFGTRTVDHDFFNFKDIELKLYICWFCYTRILYPVKIIRIWQSNSDLRLILVETHLPFLSGFQNAPLPLVKYL